MQRTLLLLTSFILAAATLQAQIDPDRFTRFLNNQPYKIYFWYDSLGGNPYDLNCPPHFSSLRLQAPANEQGKDTTLLLQTNFQSRNRLVYYFVPSLQDQNADIVIPGRSPQLLSSEKPYAPDRPAALQLQQMIDTATSDIARYNHLLEKARQSKADATDYLTVTLFATTAVFLFLNTDENGKVSGGSTALGGFVAAGGVYTFIHTLAKSSRHDALMKEIRQIEISLNMKF